MSTSTITRACARFRRRLEVKFPASRTGVYSCRRVSGSTTWSQHAWGNALDIFGAREVLERVVRWATGRWVSRLLGVQTVIWQERVWSWDTHRWEHYDGIPHVAHVHMDFRPRRVGTPPCAA